MNQPTVDDTLQEVRTIRSSLASVIALTNAGSVEQQVVEAIRALYALETVVSREAIGYVEEAIAIVTTISLPQDSHLREELSSLQKKLQTWHRRALPDITLPTHPNETIQPTWSDAVDVSVDAESKSNFYTGLSGEIAAGGVFVPTDMPHPVGTELQLRIHLLGASFGMRGQIAWVRDAGDTTQGMGVRFLDLEPPLEQSILKFAGIREPLFQP